MGGDAVNHYHDDSPTGDVAYLVRSDHRVPALVAMTERPRSRSELCELTGVSTSTMRRTIAAFEARSWVRKEGYRYVATRPGEVIAAEMERLLARVETERSVRAVWDRLPAAIGDLSIETWGELTVTAAEPDAPYRPVKRFETLLGRTSAVRFLRPEVALMEFCFDLLEDLLDDGVDLTLIDRPACHAYFFSTYPEHAAAMVRRDNFTVLAHDDLPAYGVGLLDDRVIVSCYEAGSGTVQALIDTDDPTVREWARSTVERYAADARAVEPPRITE